MKTAGRQSGNRVGALLAGLLLIACGTADPVAQPALLRIAEGGEVSGTLRVSGTAGHRVTFGLVSPPAHGALRLDADTGTFVYRAERYYNGEDRFTFTASAGGQTSAPATVTLQVAAVNDRPAAQGVAPEAAAGGSVLPNGVVELLEDGAFSGRLQALDPDMQVLTFQVDAAPTGGTLELDPATGDFTYRPVAHWSGVDRFTYSATDGGLTSDPATVTLVVAPVNDAPTGQAQSYTVDEDALLSGRLAASDLDSTVLTYSVATQPAHGSVVVDAATGAFNYQPEPDFSGADSFGFTASDGLATSLPAVVAITVSPVNDAPVATGQAIALDEDGAFAGQLAASDVDGPVLVYAVETPPAHGTLDLDPGTGAFVFRPAPDYFGPDAFAFTVTDGFLVSAPATVTALVQPVNDAPVALGQAVALDEDTVLSGQLLATDVEGEPLTYTIAAQPAHGIVALDAASGAFTYHPVQDYAGQDAFTFTASDGSLFSEAATLEIAVRPVNDVPEARDLAISLDEDGAFTGQVTATDVEDGPLTYQVAAHPVHGTLSLDGVSGAFVYRPVQNYHGADQFAFVASDGQATSLQATVSVEVRPVNDAPAVLDLTFTLAEDGPLTERLHATDDDGDAISYAVVGRPLNGKLSLNPQTGVFTYKPDRDFWGEDWFAYQATDGLAHSRLAKVALVVAPFNDVPIAVPQSLTVANGGVITGRLTANDADRDDLTLAIAVPPSHGNLEFDTAAGTYTYTPAAGFAGDDEFEFVASDAAATSAAARVDVVVEPMPRPGPRILGQAGETTVLVGARATLSVTATGEPPLRYVWWRDGQVVPGAGGPLHTTPPLTARDNGASYAVTVFDTRSGITSLSWQLDVLDAAAGSLARGYHSNRAELFPRQNRLAIRAVTPLATGLGATIALEGPAGSYVLEASGAGAVAADPTSGALTVAYSDGALPERSTTTLTLRSSDAQSPEEYTVGITFTNTAWWAQAGTSRVPSVSVQDATLPLATSRVADWIIASEEPTEEDVAFAVATWGGAVAAAQGPTAKAQAVARAIIDALEGARGVPDDRMNASPPFTKYMLATTGQGRVWCSSIAAIFVHACRALGIPARIISMGRYESLGAAYNLLVADGHTSTEIFDEETNGWVWMDPTFYVLGARLRGGPLLDIGDALEAWTSPARRSVTELHEYAPDSGSRTVLADDSSQRVTLDRYLKASTTLSIRRNGTLYRELSTNRAHFYASPEPLSLAAVHRIQGDTGIEVQLESSLPGIPHFEYRETYSSDGRPDPTLRRSDDGRVFIRFADPRAQVGQAKRVAVMAVDETGAVSTERVFTVWYYSREFYATYGLSTTGVMIFDDGGVPPAALPPSRWMEDRPGVEDIAFARSQWLSTIAGVQESLGQAQELARTLLIRLAPYLGTGVERADSTPFDLMRGAEAGGLLLDSHGISRIFAQACNSLGLVARVVRTGRVLSEGPDYELHGADPRAAVEVFDPATNRWVAFDLASGVLGAARDAYGPVTYAELLRDAQDPRLTGSLSVTTIDWTTGRLQTTPWSSFPGANAVRGYAGTQPTLSYSIRER